MVLRRCFGCIPILNRSASRNSLPIKTLRSQPRPQNCTSKTVKVTLDLDNVKDKGDWDVTTTVSSKYKKVEAADILGKLLKF